MKPKNNVWDIWVVEALLDLLSWARMMDDLHFHPSIVRTSVKDSSFNARSLMALE